MMSCQRLLKSLKSACNYSRILSHVNYVYKLQSFKYYANSQFLSSASFGTSAIQCSDDESVGTDEADLYYFEGGRRLAKHVDDPNMPEVEIILITKDKIVIPIKARVGMTVLKAALKCHVPMDAACEAKKACTTCHCYVDENIRHYFTPPDLDEEDLLDVAPFCKPTSRLSCQLKIIKQFDKVEIRLPKATINFAVDKEAKKQTQ